MSLTWKRGSTSGAICPWEMTKTLRPPRSQLLSGVACVKSRMPCSRDAESLILPDTPDMSSCSGAESSENTS